ncbi:hypothetical protein LCGC14_1641920 [marine sediment metagenome]|uniref:Uncharacterized protein n=1 Tax=marine sediment metagenome TaxID=412755 RepID=A0A0F9KF67_9ZZZZ
MSKKILKSEIERQIDRDITVVRNAIMRLQIKGYTVEGVPTETMYGKVVSHIYLRDRVGNLVCFQKHLFTLDKLDK